MCERSKLINSWEITGRFRISEKWNKEAELIDAKKMNKVNYPES